MVRIMEDWQVSRTRLSSENSNPYKRNRQINARQLFGSALAAVIVFGALAVPLPVIGAEAPGTAPETFANLVERLLPAVVNISTTQTVSSGGGVEMPQLPPGSPFEEFKEFFDRNQPEQPQRKATSLGSGFIIDSSGYVITNNHVIQDSDEITVILQDNTRLPATLVGRDTKTDLAVLKIDPGAIKLPIVNFGDSDASRVGDWVVAIGNPFGLGGTVTAGIISARGRDINAGPYDDFLQTDASINRGNSGGPMFNLDGKVIGINTAIYSPSGGSIGIGFAIPSTTAKPVINQLIKFGEVKRGWLGVHIQGVTEEIAETLGLEEAPGALVISVMKDGPAEKSGIETGDVVLEFNGREVKDVRDLSRIVAETRVGLLVEVVLWRDNQRKSLKVIVGELSKGEEKLAAATEEPAEQTIPTIDTLGLTLSKLTPRLREQFSLKAETKGVVVTAVATDGPAAKKGILPGNVIVEVSQEEVSTIADVISMIKTARDAGRKSVLLLLEGQRGLWFVALPTSEG